MRTHTRQALLALALVAGLATQAFAQLQTYDTRPPYAGSAITFGATSTMGETFTNVSAVKSMTYNFFNGSGGNSADTSLSAVFGQWNGSSFVNGTTVSFGTISVPASNSGQWSATLANNGGSFPNFAYTFDLTSLTSNLIDSTYGYLTNPNSTYALMLTNLTGSVTGLALGLTNGDAFAYGTSSLGVNDWTFAQIVVAPGSQQLSPIPESSTVAGIVGAIFIAGLVVLRLRQRNELAPVSI
jgi:hypothetical protein